MKKHLLVLVLIGLFACKKSNIITPVSPISQSNYVTVNYIVQYGANDSIGYQMGKCFKSNQFNYSFTLPSNIGHSFEVYGNETGGNSDSIQMQVMVNGKQVFNKTSLGYISYYISE